MRAYLDGRKMDDVAIERIRTFAPEALDMHPDGYWLAYSGGKDSDVILDLAKRSGVKFTAHHRLTTADAPETVYYIRRQHPEVIIHKPAETMWQVIRRKGMPPRRNARFCCESQKEVGGEGRMLILGVRSGESNARSKRMIVERWKAGKRMVLNAILDWPTGAVWEYIRERGLRYNQLYDEGFTRVGCILCPLARQSDVAMCLDRWPRLCAAWERAVKTTWDPQPKHRRKFPTPDHLWRWWLDRRAKLEDYTDDDCPLFGADDGMGAVE